MECTIKIQKQPLKVFYKKDVLKDFAKFTGKYLSQSLFFNKVRLGPVNLLKNFASFLRIHLPEHLQTTASVNLKDHIEIATHNLVLIN